MLAGCRLVLQVDFKDGRLWPDSIRQKRRKNPPPYGNFLDSFLSASSVTGFVPLAVAHESSGITGSHEKWIDHRGFSSSRRVDSIHTRSFRK